MTVSLDGKVCQGAEKKPAKAFFGMQIGKEMAGSGCRETKA